MMTQGPVLSSMNSEAVKDCLVCLYASTEDLQNVWGLTDE